LLPKVYAGRTFCDMIQIRLRMKLGRFRFCGPAVDRAIWDDFPIWRGRLLRQNQSALIRKKFEKI
jgi:hypothetical protein